MPEPITDDQLSEWRAATEAATRAPWSVYDQAKDEGWDYESCCVQSDGDKKADWISDHVYTNADARFIALSRTALPALLEGYERQRALLREIKENIDANGPDRPDLYARLVEAVG